jgi:hypothetical protein
VFQKTVFVLPDALTARNNAIQKLSIISSSPLPGDEKEKLAYFNNYENDISTNRSEKSQKRNVPH